MPPGSFTRPAGRCLHAAGVPIGERCRRGPRTWWSSPGRWPPRCGLSIGRGADRDGDRMGMERRSLSSLGHKNLLSPDGSRPQFPLVRQESGMCGPACLVSALAGFTGVVHSQSQVAEAAGATAEDGADPWGPEKGAESLGLYRPRCRLGTRATAAGRISTRSPRGWLPTCILVDAGDTFIWSMPASRCLRRTRVSATPSVE